MDKDEVKACIRALLSSTALSYFLSTLLYDFKNTSGCDLPLFGYPNAVEFLKSLTDTVQLFGDPKNPEVCLIESSKSSHITSLVDRQKNNFKNKSAYFQHRPKRIVIPNNNQNNPALEKPKSFNKSELKQTKECESISNDLFGFTNKSSSLKNHSTRNVLNVYYNDVENSFDSPSLQYNLYEDKPPEKIKFSQQSQEKPQDEVCYFKDVSDSESCYNTGEDSSTKSNLCRPPSSPVSYVNDGMKNKLIKLIKEFPEGLWCCDLPGFFQDMYNLVLDYREFGYTSLIQMLSELPDVFRCVRPGNEDWIVFDASVPPSSNEKEMLNPQLNGDVASEIKLNLQKLLFSGCETSSSMGVELDRIPSLYKKMFGRPLDFQSLGFGDLESFLNSLEGTWLNIYNVNNKLIVVPMLKTFVHSPLKWEEALPPITAENDIFYEIFPKDVVGPEESLFELDLTRHIAVGQTVEVCVAEVWSPSKFFLQLNKFKNRLNRFMDDLQNFYNVYLNKYKMPDATIRPKQVCVGLYSSDPEFPEEWHRAQIVKVINEKTVSVNFVDYGTVTRVKKSQLRFLHRSFWSFPVQAFLAKLEGVRPVFDDKRWPVPVSKRFLELLRVPYMKAEMIDIDFKKPSMSVILHDPSQTWLSNINHRLVSENLARVSESSLTKPPARSIEMNGVDLTTSYMTNSSKSSMEISVNCSGAADVSQKENLISSETFDEFFDIPDYENNATQQIQTDCSKVVPDSKTPPFEKLPEVNFGFDEVLEFKNSCEKETSGEKKTMRIKTDMFEINEFPKTSPTSNDSGRQSPDKTIPESVANKPERLPPCLEPPLMEFAQIELMLQQQQSDMKKKINFLAVELLATNIIVKEIALSYPELALKVATQLAETYVGSFYTNTLPVHYLNGFAPVLPNVLTSDFCSLMPPGSMVFDEKENQNIVTIPLTSGGESPLPPSKSSPTQNDSPRKFSHVTNTSPSSINNDSDAGTTTDSAVTDGFTANNSCNSSITTKNIASPSVITKNSVSSNITTNTSANSSASIKNIASTSATTDNIKIKDIVEKVEIGDKNLHLVKLENDIYFCVEEVIQSFTTISNREIADRIMQIKRLNFQYKVLTKKANEDVITALKRHVVREVIFKKKKKKKLEVYLLDAKKVLSYLNALGCCTKTYEAKIQDILNMSATPASTIQS